MVEDLRFMVICTLALNLSAFQPLVDLQCLVRLCNRKLLESEIFLVVAAITQKPVLLLGDHTDVLKIPMWFEPVSIPFPAVCPLSLQNVSCTVVMWDMQKHHFHGVRTFGPIPKRPDNVKLIRVGEFPEP